MLKFDPSLYLVTHRKKMSLEKFKHIILESVKGGVTTIQIREKQTDINEFIAIGKELKKLLSPYDATLIVNDSIEVAKEIEADGIHLGQSDTNVENARQLLGDKAIIGLSIETMDQAIEAKKLPIDYISASPIFATPTKTDTALPWGIEKTIKLRKIFSGTLLAIGGICENNIDEVMKTGVDGVCVISAIFSSDNPQKAANILKRKIDERI